MEIFHIWDLERVNVKIKESFLRSAREHLSKKFKTIAEAHKSVFNNKEIPFSTFKNMLKESYSKDFFVPLEFYIKLIENLGISKEELENNVLSYKTAGGVNYVESPILPIKITPLFDMLLAHNIGDGTVINPKKGRLPYFGYRQFDKFYRVSYVRKLESVFGKLKYKKDYFEESTRPYCPSSLSSLFFKYYNLKIEDFLSDRARIPKLIFDKGKESMLAVLIAFIIDEGHIDSTQITIGLKNKLLIEDLNQICLALNYKSKVTQAKSEERRFIWRLHILRKGMREFWQDYLILNKKYPVIDLGKKGEKIEDSFEIYNRKIIKTAGNRNLILDILRQESLSVNQLAVRLKMTRQGIRYHIHKLIKAGQIKIIDNSQLNWIYFKK